MRGKKPLFRKVNTRTHHVRHGDGGEYRWSRNTRQEKKNEPSRGSTHSDHRHCLDYTPLFKFLLSRVGDDWAEIYGEAVARFDRSDPIFWLVASCDAEKQPFVRMGRNSYISGLYVDENDHLSLVDPDLRVEHMEPSCSCCTHTFNGVPFVRKLATE